MRNPAAVIHSGWARRVVVRSGVTIVALIGHLAVLLALGYESTNKVVIGEPPAATAVEIVFAPPGHAAMTSHRPATVDQVDPMKATAIVEQPNGPISPLAAFSALTYAIAPMPVPKNFSPPAKTVKRQTSSAKRRNSQPAAAPMPHPIGALDSHEGESIGALGVSTMASDVPSSWKARLLSHLDRYKRYPAAARARHVQGTALLSFGMDRDGRVLAYHLVRSSGYSELDQEVLAMIERASPLPPAPPEIREQSVQFVVPVRFRM